MKPAILLILAALVSLAQQPFHLNTGDRVVFFGDSITDQRLYTTFVETFALTRFPEREVHFVHSGWGGDRVTGGGGGGIDAAPRSRRCGLQADRRDDHARHERRPCPRLRSADLRHLLERLPADYQDTQGRLSRACVSPPFSLRLIDDVTRAPQFAGGYNGVLLRYADFVKELGAKEGLTVADLNRPVTAMLAKAKATDADLAQRSSPTACIPAPAGHLIMAASL